MPTPRWKKDFEFTNRVSVDVASIETILKDILKLGLSLRHGRLYLPGDKSLHLAGVEDILTLSATVIAKAEIISFWFESENDDASLHFKRAYESFISYDYVGPSYITISFDDETRPFFLKGIMQKYQEHYHDDRELSVERFTACDNQEKIRSAKRRDALAEKKALIDNPPVQVEAFPLTPPPEAEPIALTAAENKQRLSLWMIVPSIVGLVIAYQSGRSSERQANSSERQAVTGETQVRREGNALFAIEELPRSPDVGRAMETNWRLKNLGKANAQEVTVACGEPGKGGPAAELGTIGSNTQKDLHFEMDTDKDHLNHQKDFMCDMTLYLSYKDDGGEHMVYFDSAGNSQQVTGRKP